MSGNLNVGHKDCKWIGQTDPPNNRKDNTMASCYTDPFLRKPEEWNPVICPNGYFMTGFRMGHKCGVPYWKQVSEIRCCKL